PCYDYLKPKFFQPLGITGEEWEIGPNNITPGANGLSWKIADSLKLGQLYLQDGVWDGKQVLPKDWTRACHAQHVPNQYGYQWWLEAGDAYSARGLFGQYTYVYPSAQGVLAIMSANRGGRSTSAVLARHFPKIFGGAPLKPNDGERAALQKMTGSLAL